METNGFVNAKQLFVDTLSNAERYIAIAKQSLRDVGAKDGHDYVFSSVRPPQSGVYSAQMNFIDFLGSVDTFDVTYTLQFTADEGGTGYYISGKRQDRSGETIIPKGYVTMLGDAYWVEKYTSIVEGKSEDDGEDDNSDADFEVHDRVVIVGVFRFSDDADSDDSDEEDEKKGDYDEEVGTTIGGESKTIFRGRWVSHKQSFHEGKVESMSWQEAAPMADLLDDSITTTSSSSSRALLTSSKATKPPPGTFTSISTTPKASGSNGSNSSGKSKSSRTSTKFKGTTTPGSIPTRSMTRSSSLRKGSSSSLSSSTRSISRSVSSGSGGRSAPGYAFRKSTASTSSSSSLSKEEEEVTHNLPPIT